MNPLLKPHVVAAAGTMLLIMGVHSQLRAQPISLSVDGVEVSCWECEAAVLECASAVRRDPITGDIEVVSYLPDGSPCGHQSMTPDPDAWCVGVCLDGVCDRWRVADDGSFCPDLAFGDCLVSRCSAGQCDQYVPVSDDRRCGGGGNACTRCVPNEGVCVEDFDCCGGQGQPCCLTGLGEEGCAGNLYCSADGLCMDSGFSHEPLLGDITCSPGSLDCNVCVGQSFALPGGPAPSGAAMVWEFLYGFPDTPEAIQIEGFHWRSPFNILLGGSPYNFAPRLEENCVPLDFGVAGYEHIQGVTRLAGSGNNWMAYSFSVCSNQSDTRAAIMFARIGQKPSTNGFAFGEALDDYNGDCTGWGTNCPYNRNWVRYDLFGPEDEGFGVVFTPDRLQTYRTSPVDEVLGVETNHTNGMQAVGSLVAASTYCQPHDQGGGYDWCRQNGNNKNFLVIDASDPLDPMTISRKNLDFLEVSTSSTGMVKLASGHFLALVGLSAGKYGLFLKSDRRSVDPDTSWMCVWWGGCADGARIDLPDEENENISLVTECGSGDIYAIAARRISNDSIGLHLMKLVSDGGGGITYLSVAYRVLQAEFSGGIAGWSVYVKPNGSLAIYGTTYHQNDGNGNVSFAEYSY